MIDGEVDRFNIVRDRKINETEGKMHFCCKAYSTERQVQIV
jgi:hypothetical protein